MKKIYIIGAVVLVIIFLIYYIVKKRNTTVLEVMKNPLGTKSVAPPISNNAPNVNTGTTYTPPTKTTDLPKTELESLTDLIHTDMEGVNFLGSRDEALYVKLSGLSERDTIYAMGAYKIKFKIGLLTDIDNEYFRNTNLKTELIVKLKKIIDSGKIDPKFL